MITDVVYYNHQSNMVSCIGHGLDYDQPTRKAEKVWAEQKKKTLDACQL